MDRRNCVFFLLEYYRGITGVLCVISLQFIGFSSGEKCSLGAQIS